MPRLCPVREYAAADRGALLDYLLDDINKEWFTEPRTLSPEARELLLAESWPGNIREMKFRLTSICLLADAEVTAGDVLDQLGSREIPDDEKFVPHDLNAWLEEKRAMFISRALTLCGGKDVDAAQMLGMNPSTFRSQKKRLLD